MRQNNHKINGFSLVEVIIATGIITTGLTAILSSMMMSVRLERRAENELIAYNLAREAVEVVRNIRDNNWADRNLWNQGIDGNNNLKHAIPAWNPQNNTWSLDFNDQYDVVNLNSQNKSVLQLYLKDGRYLQSVSMISDGVVTPYYRSLKIEPIESDGLRTTQYRITATVRFEERGIPHYAVLETILTNWW